MKKKLIFKLNASLNVSSVVPGLAPITFISSKVVFSYGAFCLSCWVCVCVCANVVLAKGGERKIKSKALQPKYTSNLILGLAPSTFISSNKTPICSNKIDGAHPFFWVITNLFLGNMC